jgi:hypothetical protein
VVVDHRPELDFLDLDDLLFLAGFGGLLLRLEFVLAVIQELADRRVGVGRYLDQIEPGLGRPGKRILNRNRAEIGSGLVDQLNGSRTAMPNLCIISTGAV